MEPILRLPASIDLRKCPRALLNMPVRIRWQGPLGTRLEVTHTIDVSRQGLLVRRAEPCEIGMRVWAVFPFDPRDGSSVQPETPATVMRVDLDRAGSFRVALRFDEGGRQRPWPSAKERRKEPRMASALPIFVRPVKNAWPEESMTRDISRSGARFETSHMYAAGDEVLGKIPWGDWASKREMRGRVVRVECAADLPGAKALSQPGADVSAILTCVAVQWIEAPGN